MKRIFLLLSAVALSVSVAFAGPQVVVAGHANANISIIDMDASEIIWQYKLGEKEHCNSVYMLSANKMIFTTQKGARILTLDKEVVWDYEFEEKGEVHSVQPLKGGGFALFVSADPARILVFSKEYKLLKEIRFDAKSTNPHGQFRQAIQAKNGNWLVPLFPTKGIVELDQEGQVVNEYDVEGGAFGIQESKNGNLLLGLGDSHYIAEFDVKTKTIVKKIEALEGVQLLFMGQVKQLGKNSYMVANWSGHNKLPLTAPAPQLMVFDGDNNVTWSWDDEKTLGKVSAFYYSKKPLIK